MGYKTDQLHLTHRGRSFHFVSYEGVHANPAKQLLERPAMWFLMSGGKRWEVMPEAPELERKDLDQLLGRWLDENVFARAKPA